MTENIDSSDYLKLLKFARKLEKEVFEKTDIKIAILGTFSTQHISSVLRFMLYQKNIKVSIYQAEYNNIEAEILDLSSNLYKFKPDVILILTSHRDITEFPTLLSSKNEVQKLAEETISYYTNLWEKIRNNTNAHIFQTNIALPLERQMGNLEANYLFSKQSFYQNLNTCLVDKRLSNVNIIDVEYLASCIGKENFFDNSAYILNKNIFSLKYIGRYVELFVGQISAVLGKTKKCLVLDLDNTLWGGVVADAGFEGINLDPNNAIGEAFLDFQKYVLDLKNRGVILAVCSKNDKEIAVEPFLKNDNMILKLDDFSLFVANWEDKASNISFIAENLNIDVNSMVFFDDNPAEREIVAQNLKTALVVDVPEDPALYAKTLDKTNAFEWLQITKEDLTRTNSYIANEKRENLKKSFVNYEEYLKSLEMVCSIDQVLEKDLSRTVQLLNKTNQFNLRTQRYTESTIANYLKDENYILLNVILEDKFSKYGTIACVILKKYDKYCFVESLVMSCRVLKRGIEDLIFESIFKYAKTLNSTQIIGEYIKSDKNNMVKDLFLEYNFEEIDKNLVNIEFLKGNVFLLEIGEK